MRRNLAALVLCLLSFSLAAAQTEAGENTKRVERRDGFNGSVQSVRIERVKITKQNGEMVEGPRILVATHAYAEDMTWSEFVNYDETGAPIRKYAFTYNAEGDRTSMSISTGDGTFVRKTNYIYKGRRLVEEHYLKADGTLEQKRVMVWEGDSANLNEVVTFNGEGAITKKEIKTIDPETKRIVWTTYGPSGEKAQERAFTFNQDATKSEFTQYNQNGTPQSKSVMTSDAGVGQREKTEYKQDGSLRRRTNETRELDQYGNLSKLTTSRWNERTGQYEPIAISYYTITYYTKQQQ